MGIPIWVSIRMLNKEEVLLVGSIGEIEMLCSIREGESGESKDEMGGCNVNGSICN